jgi:hypothetical protein
MALKVHTTWWLCSRDDERLRDYFTTWKSGVSIPGAANEGIKKPMSTEINLEGTVTGTYYVSAGEAPTRFRWERRPLSKVVLLVSDCGTVDGGSGFLPRFYIPTRASNRSSLTCVLGLMHFALHRMSIGLTGC